MPKKLLTEIFEQVGSTDVQTYIQSGNENPENPTSPAAMTAKVIRSIGVPAGYSQPKVR